MRSPGQTPPGFPSQCPSSLIPTVLAAPLFHLHSPRPARTEDITMPQLKFLCQSMYHFGKGGRRKRQGAGVGGKKKGEERRTSRDADIKPVCPWQMLPLRLWASLFRLRMEDWTVCLLHSLSNGIHTHSPEGSLLLRVILKNNAMGYRLVPLLPPD